MTAQTQLPEYFVEGDGDITVFMLHGAYGSGEYFRHTAGILSDNGYRVVAWNAPGYGADPGPDNFSIEVAAKAACELVRAEASKTNVLFGHSMGCLIAPLAAKELGSTIDALVLSAASRGFLNLTPEAQKRFVDERLKPILEDGLTVPEYVSGLLKIMMAPNSSGPLVDRVYEVVSSMRTDTFVKSMKAIIEYNPAEAIAAISVPTLIIAGEYDTATPPAGMQYLNSVIPGSEYHLLRDAGHYGFAEQPEIFHKHVLDFLQRTFA